jgi:hypothetical protein
VFGQTLGQPLAVPECKHKLMGDGTPFSTYEDNPAVTCFEPDIALSDAPWRRGSLDFPLKQIPLIVHGYFGYTLVIDGKLEGLQFDTLDYPTGTGSSPNSARSSGAPPGSPGPRPNRPIFRCPPWCSSGT